MSDQNIEIKNDGPSNGPSLAVTVNTVLNGPKNYTVAGGESQRIKLATGDVVTNVSVAP